MITPPFTRPLFTSLWLYLFLLLPAWVHAAPPDLTASGVIATINRSATYNLGATGLRGWIYLSGGAGNTHGADGTMTGESRQILVTVASAPGNAVLAVDDVILGAMAANSGTVPVFTSDARKAFGAAIGDAEKTGAGTLRVKRWRAGTITDENIPMAIMGDYAATAPYTCPKSALILANARNKLVSQLLANSNFLTNDWSGAISALALLAGVQPGDPDYATVQTRLQTYARARASAGPQPGSLPIWNWAYSGLFLAEYYLATGDANVLPGINSYTLKLAQSQSINGTFGHGAAVLRPDGSGRRMGIGYGPVNAVGIVANIAIVMGRKALLAGAQTIDPEINGAIQRGSDFFAFYVNKGPIPYGEHEPFISGHSSNGKDPMCAVLFGLQAGRAAETEYYSRMTTASYKGREYGHTGQGFSYLWSAMGANMGGALAVAEHLKPVRWHLDLSRRTDGSFAYDGAEQFGGGSTSDGTYLGASGYYGMNATASYILTYSLPLQRLYITGKRDTPADPPPLTLDATTVAHAVAAANFKVDCPGFATAQLITSLSDFDPVVRHYAAIEVGKRTLSGTDLTTLRNMVTGTNANGRMGACQALGLLNDATALPSIVQRLDKTTETDPWVRAKAASAIRSYTPATASAYRDTMLTAFTANATNPDVIVWSDPIQMSNNFLSLALFGDAIYGGNSIRDYTVNAAKNLLYPAVQTGLKQPDSYSRSGASRFGFDKLPLADIQALIPDFFKVVEIECLADRMWSADSRANGIKTLSKYKVSEGIPYALAMLDIPAGFEWGSDTTLIAALNALAAYGDAARWTLPTLRGYLGEWSPTSTQYTTLVSTIASIEGAITASAQAPGLAVANSQVVSTTGPKAITVTGSSPRSSVAFSNVTAPAHGTLTGTAPNLTYTPDSGYTGPDFFTFQVIDNLGASYPSAPATVSVMVGTAGTGLKGEYFDNIDFTNLKLTRTDAQVNFDWGTGSPNAALAADTFSVRWSGLLLVPETGNYTFSTLNSDGVRLYIKGVAVIDDFTAQSTAWNDGTPVFLTAGQMVDIQMEYYENTGSAVAKLKWTGPSFAGANGAIIAKEWLFDGTGVSNRTPYAHSQSVTTLKNAPVPFTLTGSGGTLAYTILSPPAHGSLTGTPPYVTYTPASDYSGSDSFTFLVNNGSSNSTPATVSISVWAGQPVTYTWNSAVSGNWSLGTNWTGSTAPASSGQPYFNLNFAPSGTYTVTHDLPAGFLLNQMNMAGVVTLSGSSSLSFAANGTMPPQFNQNSANAVIVNTPLSLAAMTSFGGSGGGQMSLNALISGTGGLTKNSPGILLINNFNNTYSGGTVLNSGEVRFPAGSGSITPHFGTGPLTINSNATLQFNRTYLTNSLFLNDATISGGNSFTSTLGGPVVLTGISTFTFGTTGGFSITGNISGTGGLTTVGTTQWSTSGSNSYTGTTSIQAGTIRYLAAAAVAPGPLTIAVGGKANLNYTGNRVVASLTLDGTIMPPGTYGSSISSATNKIDTYFTSTSVGTITVLPSTVTTLALTSGSTPTNAGTPVSFTATVSGSSPTGNVSFYANTTLLGTSALNGSYQASLTTSSLAVGSYNITAQYAGNAGNATSTSAPLTIDVTSSLSSAPTNLLAAPGNNQVTLTWTVSAGATSYYVKRSLTSGGPSTVIGNPANGIYTDTSVINGTTYYYVVSAVNASGEGANSGEISVVPAIQPSTTTVVSAPVGSGIYGDSVTFTATVSVSSLPPTGTVTFKEGSTVLGTGTLSAGTAVLTLSTLAVGNHPVTAFYGGDGTYATSISAPCAFAVSAKLLTITGVTAANKVYDGTSAATLTGGAISSGLVGSETVTVVPGSGTFASANVGTWAVTASGYSFSGTYAGNYTLSAQPIVPNASITARPLQLTGTRTYDGTTTVAASVLTVSNNLDGSNLTLGGSAGLAGKDVGSQAIGTGFYTPVRIQSATGSTGAIASTSIIVNLPYTPVTGNTLVAAISTRGTTTNRVTAISGGGVTWFRVTQATNASGTTTEIWYGRGVSSGTTGITITQASLVSSAVVIEYSGLLTATSTDKTATSTGANSTSPVTGTTATTTQASELWIGSIGIATSASTLGSITNSFTAVDNAVTTNGTAASNSRVYALERIVSATATASSGGTLSATAQWCGAIATFKAASRMNLTLSGSAAANYTLTGLTGTVTITPKSLTTSGLFASNRPYDGTPTATLTGTAILTAGSPGSGTTGDGKSHTGDTLTLDGTPAGSFADKHAGNAKAVTVTGLSLGGAQAGNYTLAQPAGLTANITPTPINVAAVPASKTYDGTTSAPGTPTIIPALAAGDTTTVLSQSFLTAGAGSGNKVLAPTIALSDGNGGANYAVTLQNAQTGTIFPAAAVVTLGDLTATFDNNPKAVSIVTIPNGLTHSVTYAGSSTTPTNAGSYAIAATVTDPNYTGSASGELVISKATAAVTLGNLTQTYNGSPKSVSADTSPAGRMVDLTYDGSTSPPSAVGSYPVSAIVNDLNYSGSTSGTLVIAAQSITDWRTARFSTLEISAGLADDNADADGDGFGNRTEYTLGTDPRSFSQSPLTIAPTSGGQSTLNFVARRASGTGYAGLTRKYTVQGSGSPGGPWSLVTGYTSLSGATTPDNITGDDQTVTVILPATAPLRFYRLSVRVE